MQSAAWLPISFALSDELHGKRVLPGPGFDRFAMISASDMLGAIDGTSITILALSQHLNPKEFIFRI